MKLLLAITAFFISINVNAQETEFTPSNKFSGDFRYRLQETKDNQKEPRLINRLMFRVGQTFFIQPDLKFTYRLLTGTSANSGNTTVADKSSNTQGSPRYGIGLDHAFVTYNPETELSLFLGKMPQYFQSGGKNQVILDSDISPEGLGMQYKHPLIESTLDVTLNLASLWVRERYDDTLGEDQNDSFLNVAQGVLNYAFNSEFSINFGLGFFNYTSIKEGKPTDFAVQSSPDFKGNTADASSNYQNNYEIQQQFLELKWSQKPYDVALFAELVKNAGADSQDMASVYGISLGYDKFSLSYIRQVIEADAVLAVYTNSDFANGQSDSRGNIVRAGYKFNKNVALNYSLNDAERTVQTSPTKHKLSQLDLTVSF